MSKLRDIIDDAGATSYCAGQDWKPGDIENTHDRMDKALDTAAEQVKILMLELMEETNFWQNGDKAYEELRQKVESL